MYDSYFSYFSRVPVNLYKDSAIKYPRFWRRFLKVFLPDKGMAAILVNGRQPFKQSFSPCPKESSVLEKIFRGFYHTRACRPS